jgi:apolipoprotein N-acyltransferase
VSLGAGRAAVRNSAFLVDAVGDVHATYDKMHLVPFGETSTWLIPPSLARRLGVPDDYSEGDTPTLFAVATTRFGVLICWEGIYAAAAGTLARAGAELLVNLSNDDWFGGHAAAEQHFHATLLRAVETRRFLLRATNSGVTAVVDPRGLVLVSAPRDVATVVPARVTAVSGLTPYTRVGDAFAWACVLIALAGVLVAARRAGGRPSRPRTRSDAG